ncbi:MAG TPA: hypothetical protein VKU60_07865, partial [Chloroflexota bacterium]|nr:hypothetical protein [Chloroflexota bacterium]
MAQSRQRQRAERRRQALQPRSPWAGRRPYVIIGVIAAVAIAVVIYLVAGRANPPGTSSAAALAPAPNYAGAPTIDDIPCQSTEQVT